ncbi:MAG: CdaR family protein [Defluviitaleaceae bacterium]|nr:CdaR family protein [Defluviitaleaceae bacterium]
MTNIIWKITALVLAIILWIIAVNIEDPIETRQFLSVRVGFENMETLNRLGLVLLNQEEIERSLVTARLQANRRLLTQMESSDLRAYVDLGSAIFAYADLVGERITAPMNLRLPDFAAANIINHNTVPASVTLLLDRIDTREFSVSVVKVGELPTGYVSMTPTAAPQVVNITGPRTILDSIVNVRAQVDLTDISLDHYAMGVIEVYNENNIDITERVSVDPVEVEIFVPVNLRAQIPVITPALTGALPAGYVVTNIGIEPPYIDIVGRREDLADFRGITLDPIDISGMTGTIVVQQDARDSLRATPLSVQNARPHEIDITITIEREEILELVIPIENIDITGESEYVLRAEFPENLVLRVVGVRRLINGLNLDLINTSVDITDLREGLNNLIVEIALPNGIRQADLEVYLSINVPFENNNIEDDDNAGENMLPTIPIPISPLMFP